MSVERNLVMVRIADPKTEPVKEWLLANQDRNQWFNDGMLSYPEMRVLAGHSNGTTYNYLPIQLVGMFESIGISPEATPLQAATGIMECVKAGVVMAQNANVREIYFLSSDETTAKGAERMGFEPVGKTVKTVNEDTGEEEDTFVPFVVYRRRI